MAGYRGTDGSSAVLSTGFLQADWIQPTVNFFEMLGFYEVGSARRVGAMWVAGLADRIVLMLCQATAPYLLPGVMITVRCCGCQKKRPKTEGKQPWAKVGILGVGYSGIISATNWEPGPACEHSAGPKS